MEKKKVLVFIDWFLPGYRAGGPIQSCANMIAHLKDEFDFSVVTRDTDYCETNPYPEIKSNAWNLLSDGTRVFYFSSGNLRFSEIKKIIYSEEYDVAYLNGIYSYWFTLLPLFLLKKRNKKVIVAVRGMLAEGAIAQKSFKKRIFLFLARIFGIFNNVVLQASSEKEKEAIEKYFGKNAFVRIAPNLFKKNITPYRSRKEKYAGEIRLINIARIAPEKNLRFALEILKEVKGKVTFDFYGPIYHQNYMKECEQIIQKLPGNISANYHGSIPNHLIHETLIKYHFLFFPSLGENFGHVILEAQLSGCPVIISDKTTWKNLEQKKAGWALPLSEKNNFIDILQKCSVMQQEEYDLWSLSAYEFALSFVHNEQIISQNKILFRLFG